MITPQHETGRIRESVKKCQPKKGMGNLVIGRGRLLKTSLSTFQRGLLPIVLASVAEGSYPWLFLKRIRQRGPAHSKLILATQILRPNLITRAAARPFFFA